MAHLTQLLDEDFEDAVAYPAGDLDTRNGWGKVAGSGTMDLFIIAGSAMSGVQSVAMRNAAAAAIAYEKAIGVTRTAGTDAWRVTFQIKIDAGAATSQGMWVNLTAGAGGLAFAGGGTEAMSIQFHDNGTSVTSTFHGEEGSTADVGTITYSAKATVCIDITAENGFIVMIDADSDGEGWVKLGSGTLRAGSEAISRVSIGVEAGAGADDTMNIDNLRIVKIGNYVKVTFEADAPQREAKIKTPGGAVLADGTITMTVDIYDERTGELLDTKTVTAGQDILEPPDKAAGKIDAVLQAALRTYEAETRVAELAASGHEVGL